MISQECILGEHMDCLVQTELGTFKCECLCHKTVGE